MRKLLLAFATCLVINQAQAQIKEVTVSTGRYDMDNSSRAKIALLSVGWETWALNKFNPIGKASDIDNWDLNGMKKNVLKLECTTKDCLDSMQLNMLYTQFNFSEPMKEGGKFDVDIKVVFEDSTGVTKTLKRSMEVHVPKNSLTAMLSWVWEEPQEVKERKKKKE
ncbi:hypothetical protein SAMN05444266_102252 [Chitinophaga jiangningensis]|uniref:Uncharacterized protein n=1 Tax=Chitinophaga jiangningensis TaxID=1419482 RepID=A0A1M6YD78_9BACT|nr:hypothetical protein [Chitinophaga jiangningensis]SHL15929.1 hypothetical protein SAMN05444266_102252 [Chitinophaga jiangningensis]